MESGRTAATASNCVRACRPEPNTPASLARGERQPFDRHAGRGPGAQLTEAIGLDQGFDPAGGRVVQPDDKPSPATRRGVNLPADQAQIIGRGTQAVQHDAGGSGATRGTLSARPAASWRNASRTTSMASGMSTSCCTSTSVK